MGPNMEQKLLRAAGSQISVDLEVPSIPSHTRGEIKANAVPLVPGTRVLAFCFAAHPADKSMCGTCGGSHCKIKYEQAKCWCRLK